jgi:hypothetical protein
VDRELAAFEWDESNLYHMLVESPHGLGPDLCEEIKDDSPKLIPNRQRAGRSGSHLMVGPDKEGRFWTVVLLDRSRGLWRPITGWPSTANESRLYREESEG